MKRLDPPVNRGDDYTIQLTYVDTKGNPVDLTGSTVFFTAKIQADNVLDDSSAIIQKM